MDRFRNTNETPEFGHALKVIGIAILVWLFCFLITSCKVRRVDKAEVKTSLDQTQVTHKDSSGKKSTAHIDTSTSHHDIISTHTDSTTDSFELKPKAGTTTTINKDGSITGQFDDIKHTSTKKSSNTAHKSSSEHKGISDTSSEASHSSIADSGRTISTRDSTSKHVTSDSTVAANFPWKWVAIVTAVLLLLGGLFWKFRKFFGL